MYICNLHYWCILKYLFCFILFPQDTLAEATALLGGLESPDQDDTMDVDEDITDKHSSGEESPEEGVQPQVVDLSYEADNACKSTETFAKPKYYAYARRRMLKKSWEL